MNIPESTLASFNRYEKEHLAPGDFLYHVLSNNLVMAMMSADDENRAALPAIVSHMWNDLPAECWGNPDKIKRWLKRRTQPF